MSHQAWLNTFRISCLCLIGALIVVVLPGSVEIRKYCWTVVSICGAICLRAAWALKDAEKAVAVSDAEWLNSVHNPDPVDFGSHGDVGGGGLD